MLKFILFIILVFLILLGIIYFVPLGLGKLIGIFVPSASRIGKLCGIGFLSLAFLCALFGFAAGWRLVKVRRVEIDFDSLPAAFDGYKIAHLSDLHLGTYSRNHRTIEKEVEKVLEAEPDLIVFTGDIVNFMPSEIRPFTGLLSGLHAPDGVWSIMGNHDYVMYNDKLTAAQRARCIQDIQDMERSMGWHLMLNENIIIRRARNSSFQSCISAASDIPNAAVTSQADSTSSYAASRSADSNTSTALSTSSLTSVTFTSSHAASGSADSNTSTALSTSSLTSVTFTSSPNEEPAMDSIALIGVENQGREAPYPRRADLPKALSGLPDGIFKILLCHDPTFWDSTVLPCTDIDLTLSGHTHAFQFRLWNLSPCRLRFKRWAGLYTAPDASSKDTASHTADDRKLFISTGSGGNIPFRFGSWPEIDIITLHRR